MASNKRFLKGWIRFDGAGKVIPGGNILSPTKPKVGNWKEIPAYRCCNSSTSTTTSSTTIDNRY